MSAAHREPAPGTGGRGRFRSKTFSEFRAAGHTSTNTGAIIEPRPTARDAILKLGTFVHRPHPVADVRVLREDDWTRLPPLFYRGFAHELPFSQVEDAEGERLAKACLQYTRDGHDGRVIH